MVFIFWLLMLFVVVMIAGHVYGNHEHVGHGNETGNNPHDAKLILTDRVPDPRSK